MQDLCCYITATYFSKKKKGLYAKRLVIAKFYPIKGLRPYHLSV